MFIGSCHVTGAADFSRVLGFRGAKRTVSLGAVSGASGE